ncbi:MAG TPA: VOC family protein [Baekduia sp.]|uniref:VOC family protein n=1 Tax=Baekduia sp. TaxID=2600305 RepID=UPI002D77B38A|nr:VOC family protein [Baekduia sp.]HET6509009.1 VOC family protein [Baekduia sp.]
MSAVRGLHHFALTVGDVDDEITFHERVLGLTVVRRTPIDARGRAAEVLELGTSAGESGFLHSICLGSVGPVGRLGSNGPRSANLAVPPGSLGFWRTRLFDAHIAAEHVTRLGTERLELTHPAGVLLSLVEADDPRPAGNGAIGPDHAIRGLHSVTLSLMDVRETHDFLVGVLDADHDLQDLAWGRYRLGEDPGATIELLHEPYRAPGTWTFAVGTPHHVAFDAGTIVDRERLCARLRQAGYADVSPEVADGDSTSVWVRTPGGTLVDLCCSVR